MVTNAGMCNQVLAVFVEMHWNIVTELLAVHDLVTVSSINGTANRYNIAFEHVRRHNTLKIVARLDGWQFSVYFRENSAT